MIVRPHPSLAPDDALVDREALAAWHQRSVRTIRHFCTPAACDVQTRRTLYLHSEYIDKVFEKPKRKRLAKDEERMAA